MTEELYYKLLRKSEIFCKHLSVEYQDFLHDIICEYENVDESNISSLLDKQKTKHFHAPIIHSLDGDIPIYTLKGKNREMTLYLHCLHCDLVLPEWEFYKNGWSGTKKVCKTGWNAPTENGRKRSKKSRTKERTEIKDGYVKDILKKLNIPCTEANIILKREQILAKRMKKNEN